MQNQHLTHSLASPDMCRFLPHASHDVCHSSSRLTHGNQGDRSQFRSTRLKTRPLPGDKGYIVVWDPPGGSVNMFGSWVSVSIP
ncbi:hypothetical protein Pmani_040249, partial [Petrolisthes manimaculis]